ncbi:hypothetical protein TWF102_004854 [Orbilia oligospora]|uniref:Inner kinetochore subunit AME1 domain-containing protein n=1 Tax=Orbilia oligospora TaxID=2813651 RepID=A0A7C8JVR3_ORBOL|nr:hypothetical protein TWF102_004854 [Orbilia oligospora]KAF3104294.1 hypothetical protein TWF103_006957 [Orbilia oligospora]KAF3108280.1 hypothetical protein TWF706_002172 [Orbilia oligospora]KAF3146122.1 hypothetical protein TWF703_005668 [Orbilia oligospora]
MSEITRQRHEERMAERRRGAAGAQRVVTQSFGFDIPLIIATPPEARAQRAAEKRPILTVEEPAEAKDPEPAAEESQPRRSGRLSRGSSVLSTPSGLDSVPDEDGSARKRRRVSSSPARSVSSRGRVSAPFESSPDVVANGRPTPAAGSNQAAPASAMANLSLKTPVTRSTAKTSTRRSKLAPDASPMLSSPSPLPPRSSQQVVPSSISPEPMSFTADVPSEVGITPEPATPLEQTIEESALESVRTTGLRSTRRGVSTTPVPRGKRGRQPSSDIIQTPDKPPTPEPEIEEESILEEEAVQEERPDTPPEDREIIEDNTPVEEIRSAPNPNPTARRRGRKPRQKRQLSAEILSQDPPTQEVENEAIFSDVEPEPLEDEADESRLDNEREETRAVGLEEIDEDFEEVEEDAFEEEEAEEEPATQSALSTGQQKKPTKAPRRPRQAGKSKLRHENGEPKETLDITVYRIAKQGDFNFKFPKQPNNIQIAGQVLHEHIDKQLETLSLLKRDGISREEKARIKVQGQVVINFSTALENRLIGMASRADNIKMKSAELRRLQKEKVSLRDELMRMRESREDVARQMDAVRKTHEEASEKAHKQQYINETLQQMGPILDKSGANAAKLTSKERILTTAHLDTLIDTVTADLCGLGEDDGIGGGRSILEQVKEMNRFLEAATEVLRGNR